MTNQWATYFYVQDSFRIALADAVLRLIVRMAESPTEAHNLQTIMIDAVQRPADYR